MTSLRKPGEKSSTNLATLRLASAAQRQEIRDLLQACGLPTLDLESSRLRFVVAQEGVRVVATGALQDCGALDSALLRSVAVAVEARGRGLGRRMVAELERVAIAGGITRLVLLTEGAAGFFESLGYHVIARAAAPADIQRSAQFSVLCPASSVCLAKELNGTAQHGA